MSDRKARLKKFLEERPALKWLVPVAQFFLVLRFKWRQCLAKEILRWRLVRLWMAKRRPLLLFVRFGGIGDIICSFPAYAALCRANPTKQGVYVTLSSYDCLPLLAQIPGCVCLSPMHCPIPRLPRWLVSQVWSPEYRDALDQPSSDANLSNEFYRACGMEPETGIRPKLYVKPDEVRAVRAKLNLDNDAGGKTVVIHTGPSWKVREWPLEHWQILVDGLRKAVPKVRIFQIGANAYLAFEKPAPTPGHVESLVGKLSLAEMAALLAASDLFIGIDSGMLHMAVAVGTPTIGLFGPTDPKRISSDSKAQVLWNQLPCSFCHHRQPRLHYQDGCPHDIACMNGLKPALVLEKSLEALDSPLKK